MESAPLFSVIMPVYKVEKYLSTAIESVLAQDYPNFELILVDDCSPDNCGNICDAYAAKDSRVKVVHKPKNEGLGMARNTGIAKAAGKYLCFVDSDDTLCESTLQTVQCALKNDTEILVFGLKRIYEDKNGKVIRTEELHCAKIQGDSVKDSGDIFLKLTEAHLFPYAWNKVYKTEFLINNNTTFERTKLIEDFLFNIALFAKAQNITVIPDCLYNYRKPAHQTLASTYAPEFYDLAKRKFHLELEFLKITENNSFDARQIVFSSHIKHIVSVFIRNRAKGAGLSIREQREKIRNILNDDTTVSMLREYVPSGMINKIVCFLLKNKMTNACYFLAMLANFVKRG